MQAANRNIVLGTPGTKPIRKRTAETEFSLLDRRFVRRCELPYSVEIISSNHDGGMTASINDGICATSPSPTDRRTGF